MERNAVAYCLASLKKGLRDGSKGMKELFFVEAFLQMVQCVFYRSIRILGGRHREVEIEHLNTGKICQDVPSQILNVFKRKQQRNDSHMYKHSAPHTQIKILTTWSPR